MQTKVVLLSDKGSRFPLTMAEGLLARPDVEPFFSQALQVLGRPLTHALSDEELLTAMDDADLIFLCERKHYRQPHIIKAIDQRRLWPKVVVCDFQDSPKIERSWLKRARAYFKRSFPIGVKRKPRRQRPDKPIFPLDFCVLHCYPEVFDRFDVPRDIDVGYYFQLESLVKKRKLRRRGRVLRCLQAQGWTGYNTRIGQVTVDAMAGRNNVSKIPEGNPWVEYLGYLKRTKILFTAFPDRWDGDMRTWEAISSGALCFLDQTYISSPNYFEHGRHCFFYDASDTTSVRDAIQLARTYLQPEKQAEREAIAARGRDHALHFHRSINRVDYLFDTLAELG